VVDVFDSMRSEKKQYALTVGFGVGGGVGNGVGPGVGAGVLNCLVRHVDATWKR
jgi:hypothetical protein